MSITEQHINPWLAAARDTGAAPAGPRPEPPAAPVTGAATEELSARVGPVFVGGHGGAGVSTWATILDGSDAGPVDAWKSHAPGQGTRAVLVVRASMRGTDAAKSAIAAHGPDSFSCVLMVAAAPGRTPRPVADEIRVLSGAITVVPVPWIPVLLTKRAGNIGPETISAKDLDKVTAALTGAGALLRQERN